MMRKTVLVIAVIILSFLKPNIVLAQESFSPQGVTVFPALIEINTAKGQQSQTSFTVINNSDVPLPISLEVKSIIPADKIIDLSKRSQFDASRWVEITPQNIALEPGQSKRINLNIDVPQDATAGGHYAEILVKELTINQSNNQSSNSKIIRQVKIPVFINLEGEIKEELIIESGDKFRHLYQKNTTYTTQFEVANTGNTHLLPTFSINFIKNGKVAQREIFVPGVILPNTKKTVSHTWQPNLPLGIYEVQITVDYGKNNVKNTETEKSLVIPNVFLLAIASTLILLAAYIFVKRNNLKKAFKTLIQNS